MVSESVFIFKCITFCASIDRYFTCRSDTTVIIHVSALEAAVSDSGGPSALELMEQLDVADLTNSCTTTPSISPSPSLLANNGTPQSARRSGIPTPTLQGAAGISTPERLRRMTKF